MDFSFLSPLAFKLLYALPLLVVPYLLQKHGKRVIVPALFLYEGLPSSARRRLWGKLHLTPLFFLQLLILLLLIAAAAQPLLHRRGGKVAIVLDTSASMQARALNGTGSIFDEAKQRAASLIATLPNEDTISLFTSAPFPRLVSTSADTRSPMQKQLASLTGTDAPDARDEVLSAFFSQLLKEQDFQRIVFFTDRPLAESQETDALTVQILGEARPNMSISSFRLYRSPFAPDDVDATITIAGTERGMSGNLSIEDAETGKLLVSQPLAKDGKATLSFPHLPLVTVYRARLLVEDGLAIDNQAYAVLPTLSSVPVLLVTPSPNVAKSLAQIPNLKIERVNPQDYTPARATDFPVVLFHLTAPEVLPETNAAFILPPEGNTLFPLGKSASRPQVTQWTAAHPLTSYVTFSLLTPVYAQAFLPVGWCKPVISTTVGPLVLAGERNGRRYAAVGFDILPYLGKQNLPVSILTLNLLGWLAEYAGQPVDVKTGSSLPVQNETAKVYQPNGEVLSSIDGAVVLTNQGVYTLSDNGVTRRVAVNLTDPEESELGRPLRLAPLVSPAPLTPETIGWPLWPWILLAVLLLLLLEWWFATRT